MSKKQETLKIEIYNLLKSRGLQPMSLDSSGKTVPVPDEAEVFQFEFIKDDENYGKVYVTIDGLHQLIVYYSDDVASSPKAGSADSESWENLLRILKRFATQRQLSFELSDQDNLENDMAKREHLRKQEHVTESYYAQGKKASYSDNVPTVTMRIQHSKVMAEGEQRFRHIERIFVENQLGERFLLPTNKPGLGRVYARHIAEGGKSGDDRWNHITGLCEEYNKMAGFVRATRNGQFNESAQRLVTEGINHYQKLRESLSKLTGKRGYNAYFESYTPALMEDEEQVDLSEMFMSSSLDPRIESVMPILSKLSKNLGESKDMAETIALEAWVNGIVEGPAETIRLGQFAAGGGIAGGQNPADILGEVDDEDYVDPEEADYGDEYQDMVKGAGEFAKGIDQRKLDTIRRMHDIISGKDKAQGMAEGEGNLSKALDTLSGSWSGWHQVDSYEPDIEKYEWDDGEGGYYAGGSIEHNLQTGEITVDFADEYNDEIKGTFKNIGDAMRALRNGYPGSHGGKSPNFDRLGQRTPPGPDDLRKTDRTGRKGTIGGGYAGNLKGSIQANKGRLGPKGVLPEQGGLEEDIGPQQKAVGQLGATAKVSAGGTVLGNPERSQKGLRGKLVGTSESVDPLAHIIKLTK